MSTSDLPRAFQRSLSSPVTGFEKADKRITQVYKLMDTPDYRKNFDKIATYIEGNPYILTKNIPGKTFDLLEFALERKCNELVRIFLPYVEPGTHKSYLHLMIKHGLPIGTITEALKYLDINVQDRFGNPPIFYANTRELLLLLLDKGARLDIVNDECNNYLHYKIKGSFLSESELMGLLKYKEMKLPVALYSSLNKNKEDPFSIAISKNYMTVAQFVANKMNASGTKIQATLEESNWFLFVLTSEIPIKKKASLLKNVIQLCTNNIFFLHLILSFYEKNDKNKITTEMTQLFEEILNQFPENDSRSMLVCPDYDGNSAVHRLSALHLKDILILISNKFNLMIPPNNNGEFPHDVYAKNKMMFKLEKMAARGIMLQNLTKPERSNSNSAPFSRQSSTIPLNDSQINKEKLERLERIGAKPCGLPQTSGQLQAQEFVPLDMFLFGQADQFSLAPSNHSNRSSTYLVSQSARTQSVSQPTPQLAHQTASQSAININLLDDWGFA